MLDQVLSASEAALVADCRSVLRRLAEELAALDAPAEDRTVLATAVDDLDGLFLLVIVGEFNAGKSTLVNALLGLDLLAVGVLPTTARVHIVRYGDHAASREGAGGVVEVEAPVALLRGLALVDTPGTNSLERDHEVLTRRFVPRADLVLVVTSADRPFSESERAFLAEIRDWGKKLVFVVNKVDQLRAEAEVVAVVGYVREAATALLGSDPVVMPVAARLALAGGEADLAASGFAALEAHINNILGSRERLALKIGSPLGVARRLGERYTTALSERRELLAGDLEAFADAEAAIGLYREDLERTIALRLSDVEVMLARVVEEGRKFFDEHVRLGRLAELFDRERIRAAFEHQVVGDLATKVEKRVHDGIDGLLAVELRQWQALETRLAQRRSAHPQHRLGAMGRFDLDRERTLTEVARVVHRAVEGFDRGGEARRLAETMRSAVTGTALLEVGAVGLGAAVAALATTQLADVTGILAASTLAILGLLVLPARREKAKRELAERVATLRTHLLGGLGKAFGDEVEASATRLREAVEPSARLVRAEAMRLDEHTSRLVAVGTDLAAVTRRATAIGLGP